MKNLRVLIAKSSAEMPRYHQFQDSLDRLITPPGTEIMPLHSSSPAKNRNLLILEALRRGYYSHIFFVDDDQAFREDTLMRLLSRDVDIVSGMYCVKFEPFYIIALDNPNENNMSQFINMNKYKPNELIEVPRVPAGCLLVKTSALETIQEYIEDEFSTFEDQRLVTSNNYVNKWFTLGHIQPDEWGDDLWFCDRAREAGLKIYLDTGVPVGHMTPCALWPVWMKKSRSGVLTSRLMRVLGSEGFNARGILWSTKGIC